MIPFDSCLIDRYFTSEKSKLSSNHIDLNRRYSELESNHTELLQKNTELSNYISLLEERLRLLKAKRFGKSSEKTKNDPNSRIRQARRRWKC